MFMTSEVVAAIKRAAPTRETDLYVWRMVLHRLIAWLWPDAATSSVPR